MATRRATTIYLFSLGLGLFLLILNSEIARIAMLGVAGVLTVLGGKR